MAAKCLAAIRFCRLRVTRLEQDGTPSAGPNNVYVTAKPMELTVTPVKEEGEDRTRVGGCDCIVAAERGKDKLKWFEFGLTLGVWEPGLVEMMTGAAARLDTTDPIGFDWPVNAFECDGVIQPAVVIEGWQDLRSEAGPDPQWPFLRHVYPMTFWSPDDYTANNDFGDPKLVGYSQLNGNWGLGIYDDLEDPIGALGSIFYDTEQPAAACGYQSHTIT